MTNHSSPIIDYLFTSNLGLDQGAIITHSFSQSEYLIIDQLKSLLDASFPSNLQNSINVENYTILPFFINKKTKDIIFKLSEENNELKNDYIQYYLYTITLLKLNENENENEIDGINQQKPPIAKSISIITSLPLFEILKPLLCYLLHETFNPSFNFEKIDYVFQNLNNSHLDDLLNYFNHLNPASRFVLTRIQPDFSLNEFLKLPENLSSYFNDSGNLYKTSIGLDKQNNLKFPIQIPKSSIIASPLAMFGIDLQRNSNIKNLINTLNSTQLLFDNSSKFKESCLTPYLNINPFHILLNALILKKKIIFYVNSTCYNTLTDFITTLFLIYNASCISDKDLLFNPIVEPSNKDFLEILKSENSYLIGTSNSLIIDQLDYNIKWNIDANELNIQNFNNQIDEIYFNSSSGSNDNLSNFEENYLLQPDYVSYSMDQSSSSISYIDSFQADNRLPYWDPLCFPRIISDDEKAELFLTSTENEIANLRLDPSIVPSKFPLLKNNSIIPRVDKALNIQIEKLIANHHDDETLFVLITNYIRNLTTKILPAFYHFTTFLQIRDYRSNLLKENVTIKNTELDIDSKIRHFIQSNHLIQTFPLNFPFDSKHAFLDDPKIAAYYTRIVLANTSLLRLAVHYNNNIFSHVKSIPGFLFSWSGGEENTNDNNVDIRLDTHYLVSILDRMIDGTSNESWQLDKYLLLQIFKILNSILKARGAGINGLSDVMVDLFIEKRGDESFAKACGLDLNDTIDSYGSSNNNLNTETKKNIKNSNPIQNEKQFLDKLRRLAVSSSNIEFLKGIVRVNSHDDENLISSKKASKSENVIKSSQARVIKSDKKIRVGLTTEHCEDDELLSHVRSLGTQRFIKLLLVSTLYLSIRSPEDIVETKKGMRRKDLLMTEFKRFLSGVLNDNFFKEFILVEMDDFIKLTVNDFIDYHM
jgi:hypothetical protein